MQVKLKLKTLTDDVIEMPIRSKGWFGWATLLLFGTSVRDLSEEMFRLGEARAWKQTVDILDRRTKGLIAITEMETTSANATVRRMAHAAREALKPQSVPETALYALAEMISKLPLKLIAHSRTGSIPSVDPSVSTEESKVPLKDWHATQALCEVNYQLQKDDLEAMTRSRDYWHKCALEARAARAQDAATAFKEVEGVEMPRAAEEKER